MKYQFLVDTYETEIVKVLSVWSQFEDGDLTQRPHPSDSRGRNLLEHMVHQSVSEDFWFKNILGIQPRRCWCRAASSCKAPLNKSASIAFSARSCLSG